MAGRIKQDLAAELAAQGLEALTAFCLKIIARFNAHGFARQKYLHHFVVWPVFSGEGFEDTDPQGILLAICRSKRCEDEKFTQFKMRFESFTVRHAEAG